MTRRSLPLIPSLGALVLLGACEPGEPTGNIFKPPLALDGSYSGTASLTVRGTAQATALSEQATLELQPIDSVSNVKGRAQVGAGPVGSFEGTYVGRDSSLVVRLLGPVQGQALGWAAFLPPLLPQCDWSAAEVADAAARVDLVGLTLRGHVNALCADEALNGDSVPAPVLVEVELDLRKVGRDPGRGS